MGSRGSPEIRARESEKSAKLMGVSVRENLHFPDGGIVNTPETRAKVAVVIRRLRPSIVITHSLHGRHPDHPVVAQLARDGCFVAGLAKVEAGFPTHRPRKVLHALSFREDYEKPTFVVNISESFEKKLEAVAAYASQFGDAVQAGEVYPNGEPLADLMRHHAAHYGSLIRCRYGEPFFTTETMRVDDVSALEVSTF
jgi:bacillithiol biosynthesis deacetylase BshB1